MLANKRSNLFYHADEAICKLNILKMFYDDTKVSSTHITVNIQFYVAWMFISVDDLRWWRARDKNIYQHTILNYF